MDTKGAAKGAQKTHTAADALREIADFSAPDQESSADAKVPGFFFFKLKSVGFLGP